MIWCTASQNAAIAVGIVRIIIYAKTTKNNILFWILQAVISFAAFGMCSLDAIVYSC